MCTTAETIFTNHVLTNVVSESIVGSHKSVFLNHEQFFVRVHWCHTALFLVFDFARWAVIWKLQSAQTFKWPLHALTEGLGQETSYHTGHGFEKGRLLGWQRLGMWWTNSNYRVFQYFPCRKWAALLKWAMSCNPNKQQLKNDPNPNWLKEDRGGRVWCTNSNYRVLWPPRGQGGHRSQARMGHGAQKLVLNTLCTLSDSYLYRSQHWLK